MGAPSQPGTGSPLQPGLSPRTCPLGLRGEVAGYRTTPLRSPLLLRSGGGAQVQMVQKDQAPYWRPRPSPCPQQPSLPPCCTSPPPLTSSSATASATLGAPPKCVGGGTPSSPGLFRPAPVALGHGLLPPPRLAGWVQAWVLVLGVMQPGPARDRGGHAASRCEVTSK